MFDMPLEYVKKQETRISMANQGIYNGKLPLICTKEKAKLKQSVQVTFGQKIFSW